MAFANHLNTRRRQRLAYKPLLRIFIAGIPNYIGAFTVGTADRIAAVYVRTLQPDGYNRLWLSERCGEKEVNT